MFGFGNKASQEDMSTAEAYIKQDCQDGHISALVRHYHVSETADIISQFAGVDLSDDETAAIIQGLRNEYGLGPIADYNMPGYVDEG